MRARLVIGLLSAALAMQVGEASAAPVDRWTVLNSPDGVFSVEAPCTLEEVSRFRDAPDDVVGGPPMMHGTRVICLRDDIVFVAGETMMGDVPGNGPGLFDLLTAAIAKRHPGETVGKTFTVNGRRAWTWIKLKEGYGEVGTTGLVEIDRFRVVSAMMNAKRGKGSPSEEQDAAIDRFFNSIRILAK